MPEKPITTEQQLAKPETARERWSALVARLCSRGADRTANARKKEILERLSPEHVLMELSSGALNHIGIEETETFRGIVFEHFVNEELNNEEENSLIANFILMCLKSPKILGLGRMAFANPDHLGVIVDTEANIAYITGMYEVKSGGIGSRSKKQVLAFYERLAQVTGKINEKMRELRIQFKLTVFPDGGLRLIPYEELQRFVVVPNPNTELRRQQMEAKRQAFTEIGWEIRASIFSLSDMDDITSELRRYYAENRREVMALRANRFRKPKRERKAEE